MTTNIEKRLARDLKWKQELDIIEQEQGGDCAGHYHRILIEKLPYASRTRDWFGCRSEWELVGYTSQLSETIILFPSSHSDDILKPTILDRSMFLAYFQQTDFFDFCNMPANDKYLYPHINNWAHCTCTHYIERVFVIRNRITGYLTRIGSECIDQFANMHLKNMVDKVKNLKACTGCGDVFLRRELNRIHPDKSRKVKKSVLEVTNDSTVCYLCAVRPKKVCIFKRCSFCPLLIKKSQYRCAEGDCYYSNMFEK